MSFSLAKAQSSESCFVRAKCVLVCPAVGRKLVVYLWFAVLFVVGSFSRVAVVQAGVCCRCACAIVVDAVVCSVVCMNKFYVCSGCTVCVELKRNELSSVKAGLICYSDVFFVRLCCRKSGECCADKFVRTIMIKGDGSAVFVASIDPVCRYCCAEK